MDLKLGWDEAKRQANLRKHGLDFADAGEVLESRYRLDVQEWRKAERRVLSIPDGHPNSPTHGHLKLPHLS